MAGKEARIAGVFEAFRQDLRRLDRVQRQVVGAAFLGWSLDAFDFFLLVFVLRDVARTYHVTLTEVTVALF